MKLTLAYEELVQAVHEYLARRNLGSPDQTVTIYAAPTNVIGRMRMWAEADNITPPPKGDEPVRPPTREAVGREPVGQDAPVRNPHGIGSPDDDTEDDGTPRP